MSVNRSPVAATFLRLTLLLSFAASVPCNAGSQSHTEPRTLSGNIYYVDGNRPAENISVELRSSGGSLIAPMTTDSTGWFEFRGLDRAQYAIAIHADGFEPLNLSFDLTYNSSRGNAIYLKAAPKPSAEPAQPSHVSAHELSIPENARALMQSGKKKLYQEKDAQGSLADFKGAILAAPGYYEACYQLAMAYLALGKRDEAEKNLRRSLELSGDAYGDAQIGVGTMLMDKGNLSEAEKRIRRGIELSPDSWMGHYELGRALLNENRISEAKESAELARSLAPSAPIVYRLLSIIHLREKDYPALLHDLDAYIQLDPNSPAGTHASELREQVRQKIAEESRPPAADPKP